MTIETVVSSGERETSLILRISTDQRRDKRLESGFVAARRPRDSNTEASHLSVRGIESHRRGRQLRCQLG